LRPARTYLLVGAVLAGLLLLVSPLIINGALVFLHHSERQAAAANHPALDPGLGLARTLAWGPYRSRAWAADAVAAQVRNEPDGEMEALEMALGEGPWDFAARYRLGQVLLASGDIAGAVDVWGSDRVVEALVERGRDAPPAAALVWLAQVQEADPNDWRPHAAAAQILARANRPEQAAATLADALWLRHRGDVVDALAERLTNPLASLPDDSLVAPSTTDGALFALASTILQTNADIRGSLFAAQLAVEADGRRPDHWARLAQLWQRVDQPARAAEARQRAASLQR
jgi:hypothetical protein